MFLLCLKTANVLLKNVRAVDLVLQKKKITKLKLHSDKINEYLNNIWHFLPKEERNSDFLTLRLTVYISHNSRHCCFLTAYYLILLLLCSYIKMIHKNSRHSNVCLQRNLKENPL